MSLSERIVDLYDKLTLQKSLLAIFTAVMAVIVYGFYEGRNAVFLTITGTPMAMLSLGIGLLLMLVAGVAWLFVSALDKKTEQTIAELRAQIERLEKQLAVERIDCDKRIRDVREMAQMALNAAQGGNRG